MSSGNDFFFFYLLSAIKLNGIRGFSFGKSLVNKLCVYLYVHEFTYVWISLYVWLYVRGYLLSWIDMYMGYGGCFYMYVCVRMKGVFAYRSVSICAYESMRVYTCMRLYLWVLSKAAVRVCNTVCVCVWVCLYGFVWTEKVRKTIEAV